MCLRVMVACVLMALFVTSSSTPASTLACRLAAAFSRRRSNNCPRGPCGSGPLRSTMLSSRRIGPFSSGIAFTLPELQSFFQRQAWDEPKTEARFHSRNDAFGGINVDYGAELLSARLRYVRDILRQSGACRIQPLSAGWAPGPVPQLSTRASSPSDGLGAR